MINHECFQGWSLIKEVKRTHNKKNVVLMFLIVMLSFAIVSEVSAISLDDAEPDESGLDVKIHSPDSKMPGERFIEVSHVPVEDAIDISHSNNNQTPLNDVYNNTDGNKNLYEHNISADENQKHFDPGVIMKVNLNDTIHFETLETDSSNTLDNETAHLANDVISKLIGMYNVSQSLEVSKIRSSAEHSCAGKNGGLIQSNMGLHFKNHSISSLSKHPHIG